jgi:hypothetical protein
MACGVSHCSAPPCPDTLTPASLFEKGEQMRVFFRYLWKLSLGGLLGVLLFGAGLYVGNVRQVDPHAFKEQRLAKAVALFMQAGATFRTQQAAARMDFPALFTHLDATRRILADLQTVPLTPEEQARLTTLTKEEQRFRTALHALSALLVDDPSHQAASAAMLHNEINQAIARVTHQGSRMDYGDL